MDLPMAVNIEATTLLPGKCMLFTSWFRYQRQGIGRQLMAAVCHQLRQSGKTSLYVDALKANPYRRFYELLGGQLSREETFVIEDQPLPLVYYWWPDINQLYQDSPLS